MSTSRLLHSDDDSDHNNDDPFSTLPTRTNPTQRRIPYYNTYQTDSLDDDENSSENVNESKKTQKNVSYGPITTDQPQLQQEYSNTITTSDFALKSLSKYDMKNHMANERTFFKYLFTGLHIGSIGTLVLTFFPSNDVKKLYLVMFIWIIAFLFMFWGLYGYYRRKHLMERGKFNESSEISPHTPLLISSIFVFVIILIIFYGLMVHYSEETGKSLSFSQLFMMDEKEQAKADRQRRRERRERRRAKKAALNATNIPGMHDAAVTSTDDIVREVIAANSTKPTISIKKEPHIETGMASLVNVNVNRLRLPEEDNRDEKNEHIDDLSSYDDSRDHD